jgi:ferredoxin-NADP reductase
VTGELELVITAVSDPAPGVRGLRLAASDGRELPGFVPGSHLVLDCGGRRNAYSLTSDNINPAFYAVSVLLAPHGAGGSRWVHERLGVGSRVAALPPRSAFPPVARARRHLLVAGGIGVTPVVSHLRAARRRGEPAHVVYVHRPGRGAHTDDLVALTDGAAEILTDRAAFAARLRALLTDQPLGTHLYICGPSSLTDGAVALAGRLGWPASRVHTERFGVDVLDPGDPFDVVLTASGITVPVPAGTSLLDALATAGVRVASQCRQGVCGQCRIPVSGGRPRHRDLFLTDEEKDEGGTIMACVSRADGPSLTVPL